MPMVPRLRNPALQGTAAREPPGLKCRCLLKPKGRKNVMAEGTVVLKGMKPSSRNLWAPVLAA